MGYLALVLAYLLGSISFSWLAVRLMTGNDLRSQGSGNLGAKNTMRSLGKGPAVVVFLADVFKGWLALYLTTLIAPTSLLLPAAIMVVAGHNFPFWLRFRGGKGLATVAGVTLYLNPWLTLALLITAAIGLIITKMTNPAAIFAIIAFPFLSHFLIDLPFAWFWSLVLALIIFYRHLRDIPDLIQALKKSR